MRLWFHIREDVRLFAVRSRTSSSAAGIRGICDSHGGHVCILRLGIVCNCIDTRIAYLLGGIKLGHTTLTVVRDTPVSVVPEIALQRPKSIRIFRR